MPFLETPDELAESIADYCGVYGITPTTGDEHESGCKCRLCFVGDIKRRIRASVENERKLTASSASAIPTEER